MGRERQCSKRTAWCPVNALEVAEVRLPPHHPSQLPWKWCRQWDELTRLCSQVACHGSVRTAHSRCGPAPPAQMEGEWRVLPGRERELQRNLPAWKKGA